ncbi:proline-rich extensin-like protein EPR1 [Penaeus monodon]|uniref:proline-rich extensin-like protein EPR1 n=1 Tax=Penaeus monodon TaxID=6687 RepID=UPI0018A738FF|nr:proline-rich extensin-like protein EPR1 [Penaeus monodon]
MQSLNLIFMLALAGTSSACKYFCKSPVTQEYECCDDGNPYYNPEEDQGVTAEVVPVDIPAAELPSGPSSNCYYYCAYDGEVYCCGDVSRPSEYNDSDPEPLSPTSTTSHDPPDISPRQPVLSLTDANRPRPSPSSDQRFSPGLASRSQSDPLLNGTLDSESPSSSPSSSADSRNSLLKLSLIQKMDRSGVPSLKPTHNYLRLPLHLLQRPAKDHETSPAQYTVKPTPRSTPLSGAKPNRGKPKRKTESNSFIAPFTNIFSFMNFTMDIPDILAGFGIGAGTTTPAPTSVKPVGVSTNEKMVDVALRLSTIGREDTAVYIHKEDKDTWLPILTSVPTDDTAISTPSLDLDHLPPGTIISVHKPSELMEALSSGTSFYNTPLKGFEKPEQLSIFSEVSVVEREHSHGNSHTENKPPIYYYPSILPASSVQGRLQDEASKVSYHVSPESVLNVSPVGPFKEPGGPPIGSSYSSFVASSPSSPLGSPHSAPHPSPIHTPQVSAVPSPSSFGGLPAAPSYSPIFPTSDQENLHFKKPSIIAEVPPLEMVPPPMEPPPVKMVPPPVTQYTPEIDLTEDEVNELIDSIFCACEKGDPCDCEELSDLVLVFPPKPMEPYVFLPLDSLSSPSLSNRLPSLTKPPGNVPQTNIHSPQHHQDVYPAGPSIHQYSGAVSQPQFTQQPIYKHRESAHPPAPVYKQVETSYPPAPVYKHPTPSLAPAPVYQHKAPSHEQAASFRRTAPPSQRPAPVHFQSAPITPTALRPQAFSITGPVSFETDAFTLEITSNEEGSKEFTSQEVRSNSVESPNGFEIRNPHNLLDFRGGAALVHPGQGLPSQFANHGLQSFVAKRESQPSVYTHSHAPQYPVSYNLESSPSQAIAFRSHPGSNAFRHPPGKTPQTALPKAPPHSSSYHHPEIKLKEAVPQPQARPLQRDAQLFSIQPLPLDSFHQITAPQYFHEKPVIQILPEAPKPKTFQVTATPRPPKNAPSRREQRPGTPSGSSGSAFSPSPSMQQSYPSALLSRNHASAHSKAASSGLKNKLSIAQLLSSVARHSSDSLVTSDYSNIAIANQHHPPPSSSPAPATEYSNNAVANYPPNTSAPTPTPASSFQTLPSAGLQEIKSPVSTLSSQSVSPASSPSSSSPSTSSSSSGSTPQLPSPSPSTLPPLTPKIVHSVSSSVSSSSLPRPHNQTHQSSPSLPSSSRVRSLSRAVFTRSPSISQTTTLQPSLSTLQKSTASSSLSLPTSPSLSTPPSPTLSSSSASSFVPSTSSPSSYPISKSTASPPQPSSSLFKSSSSLSSSSSSSSSSPQPLKSSPSSPSKSSLLFSKLKSSSTSSSPSSSFSSSPVLSSSSSLPSSSSS